MNSGEKSEKYPENQKLIQCYNSKIIIIIKMNIVYKKIKSSK